MSGPRRRLGGRRTGPASSRAENPAGRGAAPLGAPGAPPSAVVASVRALVDHAVTALRVAAFDCEAAAVALEQFGRRLGRARARDDRRAVGGRARAAALTPERRREIAKRAAAARWGRE